MISRSAILGALLTTTLLTGLAVFYVHANSSGSGVIVWAELKALVTGTQRQAEPSDIAGHLRSLLPAWSTIAAKTELTWYLLLALVAGSTIAFVLSRGSRQATDPKDVLLEILKEEKQRAEKSAKIKSEFLNHVSHELRTPLAVIIGYVECITDGLYGQLGTKHQEILEIVAKQSAHLKEMIDQILIYSRLDSNRHSLHLQEFPLKVLLTDLKETFGFLCAQKGLSLFWEVPNEPVEIQSDPAIIKEILSNLLQNSIKYTDAGSITVTVSRHPETHALSITVSDTGLGIPEQYLATVFEPFVQVHKTSTDRSRGGIGLGLSIVKKHVELIKGHIRVESEVGKGSRFTMTFPQRFERQHRRQKEIFQLFRLASLRPAKALTQTSEQLRAEPTKDRTQAVG